MCSLLGLGLPETHNAAWRNESGALWLDGRSYEVGRMLRQQGPAGRAVSIPGLARGAASGHTGCSSPHTQDCERRASYLKWCMAGGPGTPPLTITAVCACENGGQWLQAKELLVEMYITSMQTPTQQPFKGRGLACTTLKCLCATQHDCINHHGLQHVENCTSANLQYLVPKLDNCSLI